MNKQKWLFLVATVALMVIAASLLNRLRTHQKLGSPGIKAMTIPGSVKMEFDLPERAAGFISERIPEDKVVLDILPKDTSFAQRYYTAADGFWVNANVVLMGTDRTSIHKPEFCLAGGGWRFDQKTEVNIPIDGTRPYQLKVAKWVMTRSQKMEDGQEREVCGIYVFWFVADNEETASHWQRVWWLARDLLHTGVLQRWAYVSYFTACAPGQEQAAFERVKKLIAASVPEFQLPPKSANTAVAARQ